MHAIAHAENSALVIETCAADPSTGILAGNSIQESCDYILRQLQMNPAQTQALALNLPRLGVFISRSP